MRHRQDFPSLCARVYLLANHFVTLGLAREVAMEGAVPADEAERTVHCGAWSLLFSDGACMKHSKTDALSFSALRPCHVFRKVPVAAQCAQVERRMWAADIVIPWDALNGMLSATGFVKPCFIKISPRGIRGASDLQCPGCWTALTQ